MIVPQQAIDLVKLCEGLRLHSYRDAVGFGTVGYGHKISRGEGDLSVITEEQANVLLEHDLGIAMNAVIKYTKVPLNENQLSALIDFVFNLGSGCYYRSTLRMKLNRGEYFDVPHEFKKYVYAGTRKLPGLVHRRFLEAQLWIS